MLEELVSRGTLTARQAELARKIPVAEDITAEADSGGHTDRRPLPVLIPLFRRLADRIAAEEGYAIRPRVGAAGGIGDPWSFAAALTMGADYVMTGSINQATREAGTSDAVREMLAQAGYADVTMGPAPDMFEIGAQVQVLARGTMYAQRAAKLHEIYKGYANIEDIPSADREKIEKQIFQRPLAEVWRETEAFWAARDPREVDRANRDGRHKMALCFRWYLGLSSRWARVGDTSRKRDYQIWCGPAMGLFNDWVRGSWLEPLPARTVVSVADAMLHGACVAMRVSLAETVAGPLPDLARRVQPWRAEPHA
jgi:PfaD family protein